MWDSLRLTLVPRFQGRRVAGMACGAQCYVCPHPLKSPPLGGRHDTGGEISRGGGGVRYC